MNTLLQKITLMLFLILGLGVFNMAHSTGDSSTETIERECPIKGQVNLRLTSGDLQHGTISGWINGEYVYWNVFSGRISTFIGNQYVTLTIEKQYNNEHTITGWVGSTYIRWTSLGGYWNEWVYC